MRQSTPALLALADGSIFHGVSIGIEGSTVGEVVFNTAMTGYQEILTDPSYREQIVTLTYPHIGNVGVNPEDNESEKTQLAGLILREVPRRASNFRSTQSFSDYLLDQRVVAIAGIDTRRLTRILRDKGAQNGCIVAGSAIDEKAALKQALAWPGLKGMDLAKVVTTVEAYVWQRGSWELKANAEPEIIGGARHVVVYDFGVKRNILRMLVDRGCKVTVVPAKSTAADVLKLKPDGVMLSNGPGDPEPCDYAIAAAREFLAMKLPTFGICLGHQILGLAAGAKTLKMKFGHHGANHPVQDLETSRVLITSQNHGFAVDEQTLPANALVTHRSLFDGSNQGLRLTDAPAFSFQGHPEASPGPHDVSYLFDRFVALMENARG
ncbi:glutamine-hydrolyzing carbamoyl-phosphate synthase small subunit [Nevskia sp.]|uniref:glutamine-hydrolyzing carbamoyl-phosphate synthase small subunit n=1 Tax=Nevskia sp. TaxID=1929292 RepID=UPI0025FF9D12|nr:glutamine-hydrolyzing carbamoyl-phosphate synthase small subunit [Nevskia sp.]